MKIGFSPTLNVLNDLCYVIECSAMTHMGEGKRELRQLISDLESKEEYAIGGRVELAAALRRALELQLGRDGYACANVLSQEIRKIWASLPEA